MENILQEAVGKAKLMKETWRLCDHASLAQRRKQPTRSKNFFVY